MRNQREQNPNQAVPKAEHCPKTPEIAGLAGRNSSMLGIQKEQRTRREGEKNGEGRPNFAPVEKARAGGACECARKRSIPIFFVKKLTR
ncbi:hypothetical protein NL676_030697 [Syzygium grande]|nr:hypothetical protein NL676_030697 [Syzygium grande]